MVAAFIPRLSANCLSRPSAAATASLLAVTAISLLLGIVFLPRKLQRLSHHVSITHCLTGYGRPPTVALFWSIADCGNAGRDNYLAVNTPGATSATVEFPWPAIQPQSIAAGPDPEHVIVGTCDGKIYLLNLKSLDDEPRCIARQPIAGIVAVACSADGQTVLSQSGYDLFVWDAATGALRWRSNDVSQYGFVLRPDSKTAIVGRLNGDLVELDVQSGATLRTFAQLDASIVSASLSDDGNSLAILVSNGVLHLLDGQTGACRWADHINNTYPIAFGRFTAFSPGGTLLVTASKVDNTALVVWDAATGRPLKELRGHESVVHGAAFATSGELRSWGSDGTIRVWDLTTGAPLQVTRLSPARVS